MNDASPQGCAGIVPRSGYERALRALLDRPGVVLATVALAAALGVWAVQATPVDAIPDLSDNQVLVVSAWPGQAPLDVEDRVTFPLASELRGMPQVETVRGLSGFGFSQLFVVFEDGVDPYWARTRVLERLASRTTALPAGVEPKLGPDATPLGQVLWYTLEADGVRADGLAALRTLQDTVVAPAFAAVDGVAEVASVGGHVREVQVDVDPERLRAVGLTTADVRRALSGAGADVGAHVVERSGMELVVRGVAALRTVADVRAVPVGAPSRAGGGTPWTVGDVADVHEGPAERRGVLVDEAGERVGGVVTMRYGENPKAVVAGVRAAMAELASALPPGVRVVPFYDRTRLVDETMATLWTALAQAVGLTVLVLLAFLASLRASLVVASTLPLAIGLAFVAMRAVGVDGDLMSLTGLAIAIGTIVDMGIVVAEAAIARLAALPDGATRSQRLDAVAAAAAEVAPAIGAAMATTVLGFLPVFLLEGEAGRLFTPLAWTKTLALVGALVVAVVWLPAFVARAFVGSARRPSRVDVGATSEAWLSRAIRRGYEPTLRWVLAHRAVAAVVPVGLVLAGAIAWGGSGVLNTPFEAVAGVARGVSGEGDDGTALPLAGVEPFATVAGLVSPMGEAFMPPLDEGALLAMPSLLHQASLSEAVDVAGRMNRAMLEVPEIVRAVAKVGRAETALDPAPVGMLETVVQLAPEDRWRPGMDQAAIVAELRERTAIPGVSPSWLQPIETRIVMLQSGLRAAMAVELVGAPRGADGRALDGVAAHGALERAALALEETVARVPGTADVSAVRLGGKPYLEVVLDRERAARFGVRADDVAAAVADGVGGRGVAALVEGREQVGVRLRVARELRGGPEALARLQVPSGDGGGPVPLGRVADVREVLGPASVRTLDGELTGYVTFNVDRASGRDEAGVMADVLASVEAARAERVAAGQGDPVPLGVRVRPAGRYLAKLEADARLQLIVPLVVLLIWMLLAFVFRDRFLALAILVAVPVTAAGGFLGLRLGPWLVGADPVALTTAVWVGFIALFGIAVDDGAVMGAMLRERFAALRPDSVEAVREAVVEAGLRRIRACLMTTATTVLALVPVLMSDGRGSDVMAPMAWPLVGGMVAELVSLFVVPALMAWRAERALARAGRQGAADAPGGATHAGAPA